MEQSRGERDPPLLNHNGFHHPRCRSDLGGRGVDMERAMTDLDLDKLEGQIKAALNMSSIFSTHGSRLRIADYIAAMNPKTALALIERVRKAEATE